MTIFLKFVENSRFNSAKKSKDLLKEIDEERKSSQTLKKAIWEEITQNKNNAEILIEINLNEDFHDKVQFLKIERYNTLGNILDDIKKIVFEKLNSIITGLRKLNST